MVRQIEGSGVIGGSVMMILNLFGVNIMVIGRGRARIIIKKADVSVVSDKVSRDYLAQPRVFHSQM
jgi:lactate dehydrogenase-like 2-hydroxyacid dehydrogenase